MTKPTCPRCHAPAYVGFTAVECPTVGCANYSDREAAAAGFTVDWAGVQIRDYYRLLNGRWTLR